MSAAGSPRRDPHNIYDNIDNARFLATLIPNYWHSSVSSPARTLARHRRPDDVVTEHKKKAARVWVGMLLTIMGCESVLQKRVPLKPNIILRFKCIHKYKIALPSINSQLLL